jgi:hypothetical protein
MSYANGPKIVTDGLVLCLDAANRKSYPGTGTAWNDLSGNGNNGVLRNGPQYIANNGGIFDFDGTDDGVRITSSDWCQANTSLSVFAWIYRQGEAQVNNHYLSIVNNSDDSILQYGFSFYVRPALTYGSKLSGWTKAINNGATTTFDTNYVISLNTWYYVGMTVQSASTSTIKYYGNGNLISSHSVSGQRFNNITKTSIGQFAERNEYEFNGYIPQVSIYNRVLSANEVQQNYNALKGRYGLT